MDNTLFIPETITVGFQARGDTFTGKLGYVIYTDEKGKLRKEASWNSWRSKELGEVTVKNDATLGFNFNKGVKRDNYWRGSGRSMIRVWDPRDFEFEITIENLIGILMHADVSKRDITEPCVFAWKGTELILLPTNSVEYQESMKYTAKQSLKVSAKDLVPGRTYGTKKDQKSLVYLGYFERWDDKTIQLDNKERYGRPVEAIQHFKKKNKSHMFIDPKSLVIEAKDPSTHLALCESEEIHPDYASFMTKYYLSAETQPVIGLRVTSDIQQYYSGTWFDLGNNEFVELYINDYYHHQKPEVKVQRFARFIPEKSMIDLSYNESTSYYSYNRYPARKLDGLDPNDQRVRALVQRVQAQSDADAAAIEAYYKSEEYKTDNNVVPSSKTSDLRKQMRLNFKLGQLQYQLADGNFANDHKH